MSFPTVVTTNSSNQQTQSGTHTVSLPSGITVGDLLVVFARVASDANQTVGNPTGFTLLASDSITGESRIWYKISDGSEGSTTTFSTQFADRSAHTSYRIEGYNTSNFIETSSIVESLNPPSLTPSWGAEDTLWIAFGSSLQSSGSASMTAPTNFSDTIQGFNTSSATTGFCQMATAQRNNNTTTEDPNAFTGSANSRPHAAIIAVRPLPAASITNVSSISNISSITF